MRQGDDAPPPGEWVTARQGGLVAHCDAQAGDGLRIRVRDAGGTVRVVDADGLSELSGPGGAWRHACRPPDLLFPAIAATVTAADAGSVTTEVRLSNPGTEPLEVIELASEPPGWPRRSPSFRSTCPRTSRWACR